MWRNMVETAGGRPILGTPFVGLLAEQILAETATGDHGPGLMYNDGLVTGKRYKLSLQGGFGTDGFVYENGSFTVTAPASTTYLLYEDNALVSATATSVAVGDGPVNPPVIPAPVTNGAISLGVSLTGQLVILA